MKAEVEPKTEKKRWLGKKWSKVAALGAAVVSFAAYQNYDRSGEVTSYDPIKEGNVLIDNRFNVLTWNMHNETSDKYSELAQIITEKEVDVVALQEVSAKDAKGLHRYFPAAYIRFAMADAKTKLFDGGYGNVLMSFQEMHDTTSVSIEGNEVSEAAMKIAGGVLTDVSSFDTSFPRTSDATQEDRTAMATTVKVQSGNDLEDIRLITSHIGSADRDLHAKQMDELMDFVDENNSEDRPTIFCGDLNYGQDKVIPRFIDQGLYVHQTPATNPKGLTIDYCGFSPGGVLSSGSVEVLPNVTDHYALFGSWQTTP